MPTETGRRRHLCLRVRRAAGDRIALARGALQWAWRPLGASLAALSGRDETRRAVEERLARIAAPAGGVVGVAASHLESGERLSLRGGDSLPMASVVKVSIAVSVLASVDRGRLRLDSMVEVEPRHAHPDPPVVGGLRAVPGVRFSIRDLLEPMLVVSDNSAADLLLEVAGGAGAVNASVQALGVTGLSVSRSTAELLADLRACASRAEREKFLADPRDRCSADAIVNLLSAIACGTALSPGSTSLLLGMMSRCETGSGRIRHLLPPGTVVAHKTGYLSTSTEDGSRRPCVVNDAGIITLPGDLGRVAIAVFVAGSPRSLVVQEKVVALIARVVYDHFLRAAAGHTGEAGDRARITGAGAAASRRLDPIERR